MQRIKSQNDKNKTDKKGINFQIKPAQTSQTKARFHHRKTQKYKRTNDKKATNFRTKNPSICAQFFKCVFRKILLKASLVCKRQKTKTKKRQNNNPKNHLICEAHLASNFVKMQKSIKKKMPKIQKLS